MTPPKRPAAEEAHLWKRIAYMARIDAAVLQSCETGIFVKILSTDNPNRYVEIYTYNTAGRTLSEVVFYLEDGNPGLLEDKKHGYVPPYKEYREMHRALDWLCGEDT